MNFESGNGPYILMTREAYVLIGGHESVKDKIVEDLPISRRAASPKLRIANLSSGEMLQISMYSSFKELWQRLQATAPVLVTSLLLLFVAVSAQIVYVILPIVIVGFAIVYGSTDLAFLGLNASILMFGTLFIFYSKLGFARYTLLAPIAGTIIMITSILGFVRFHSRGLQWKGLTYKSVELKGHTNL